MQERPAFAAAVAAPPEAVNIEMRWAEPRLSENAMKGVAEKCSCEGPLDDQLMLCAAMALAFFVFLRVGEFTTSTQHPPTQSLARRDTSLSRDQMKVFLHFSKTDQLGKGITITIGRTGGICCPVQAMLSYLDHCKASGSRPLFHLKCVPRVWSCPSVFPRPAS